MLNRRARVATVLATALAGVKAVILVRRRAIAALLLARAAVGRPARAVWAEGHATGAVGVVAGAGGTTTAVGGDCAGLLELIGAVAGTPS
jgi:hypothetical protein